MRNWIVISICFVWIQGVWGQDSFPEGIAYQAQIHSPDGSFLGGATVGVQFNIRAGSMDGTIVWQEGETVELNDFGHFNLVIGEGTSTGVGTSPSFSAIEWSSGTYFLEMLIDEANDGTYISSMTQQMMAVPYAFHAKTTDQTFALSQLTDVDTTGIEIGDVLKWNGDTWIPSEDIVADSSAYAATAGASVYADTATYALNCLTPELVDSALYAYYADSANYAMNGENALLADSASYADTAGVALYAINNWGLEGNDNVTADHFLGTLDSTDLVFSSFNTERMRIKANGRIGIGTTTPFADFEVHNTNGVLFTGDFGSGTIPTEGAGTRMMWYPKKAAFRSGHVTSTQWNDGLIGNYSFASGYNTRATAPYAVAFGFSSQATGEGAFAVGNLAISSGDYSFSAGHNPSASGNHSIALGRATIASSESSIAIGYHSSSTAPYALSLGDYTVASGENSVAIGYHARAIHNGSFVYSDYDPTIPFIESTAENQFMVKASGGTVFYSDADLLAGVELLPGAGAWSILSDSTKKENIQTVDGAFYLNQLNNVEVYSWNYIAQDSSIRHIGPMAQDFYGAFGLGNDNTTINSGDFDGVNLLLIKELHNKTSVLESQADALVLMEAELNELKIQRAEMMKVLLKLEQKLDLKSADNTVSNETELKAENRVE